MINFLDEDTSLFLDEVEKAMINFNEKSIDNLKLRICSNYVSGSVSIAKSILCLLDSLVPMDSICSLILFRSLIEYTIRAMYISVTNEKEIKKFPKSNINFFYRKPNRYLLEKIFERYKFLKEESISIDLKKTFKDLWNLSCAFVHGDMKSFQITRDVIDQKFSLDEVFKVFVITLVFIGYSSLMESCGCEEFATHEITIPVSNQYEKIIATLAHRRGHEGVQNSVAVD